MGWASFLANVGVQDVDYRVRRSPLLLQLFNQGTRNLIVAFRELFVERRGLDLEQNPNVVSGNTTDTQDLRLAHCTNNRFSQRMFPFLKLDTLKD